MTKFDTLHSDMIAAMKTKDKARKEAISAMIQTIKKAAIDEGHRDDISDEFADQMILKEQKSVKEQIDTCPAAREDLLKEYQFRYDVISEYAPKLMGEEELKELIQNEFAEVLSSGNKGLIMKTVMPALKGKADGKLINAVITGLIK